MKGKAMVSEATLQKLINDVEGAMSSRAKLDDKGNLTEIHVLADKSRNAKQIARDIQSVVTTKFDLEIDHRIISIAQLNCEDIGHRDLRITFKGMELISRGLDLDVRVNLCYKEEEYSGHCRGTNTMNNVSRTVVQATLEAVEEAIDQEAVLVVEDIGDIVICKTKVIVVAVTYVDNSGEQLLVGLATDTGDVKEAVVKATLDAVNKKINRRIN